MLPRVGTWLEAIELGTFWIFSLRIQQNTGSVSLEATGAGQCDEYFCKCICSGNRSWFRIEVVEPSRDEVRLQLLVCICVSMAKKKK